MLICVLASTLGQLGILGQTEYMVGLRNLGKDSGNGGELKRVASMGAQGNWKRQDLALEETLGVLFFVYVCVLTYT